MELKEFIKDVIFQLADGLKEVREEQKQHDVVVNPDVVIGTMSCGRYIPNNIKSYKNMGQPVQYLQLDIQLEATKCSKVEVGGGIGVSFLKTKGDFVEDSSQKSGNRMSIAIPLCLPTSKIEL